MDRSGDGPSGLEYADLTNSIPKKVGNKMPKIRINAKAFFLKDFAFSCVS